MRAESQRLEYFDSIRGLAALAVLLSHSLIFAWPTTVWAFIHAPFVSLAFNGKQAVVMFFVLSGYVLARPYVEVKNQAARKIFLPAFYLRRFIRIWLPWFGIFCLSALAQVWWFREWPTSVKINDWAAQFWQHAHDAGKFSSAMRFYPTQREGAALESGLEFGD